MPTLHIESATVLWTNPITFSCLVLCEVNLLVKLVGRDTRKSKCLDRQVICTRQVVESPQCNKTYVGNGSNSES